MEKDIGQEHDHAHVTNDGFFCGTPGIKEQFKLSVIY